MIDAWLLIPVSLFSAVIGAAVAIIVIASMSGMGE